MKDLSIMIDDIKLNIRVGVILKYGEKVLIEISKIGGNSVIPGGRIKIGEASIDALVREMNEEMRFLLVREKLRFKDIYENFFILDNVKVHELFFVYEYNVNNLEYKVISKIKNNMDNESSYFEFVKISDLNKINLLPKKIIDLIKNTRY